VDPVELQAGRHLADAAVTLAGLEVEDVAFGQGKDAIVFPHLQRPALDEDQLMGEDDTGGVLALPARDEEAGVLRPDGATSAQSQHGTLLPPEVGFVLILYVNTHSYAIESPLS